ncbi:MazG-like family protein [Kitasatospora sp. NPDC085464]|uniref:MazG-like family protein n=1 Tax=Kitasatospora sp. NPDC085464 TaxID=3364063 RepID=UPI0037C5DD78
MSSDTTAPDEDGRTDSDGVNVFVTDTRREVPPRLRDDERDTGPRPASRAGDWAVIDAVHRHLSEHRAGIGQPLLTLQVVKVQEEAGEVAEALLGVLGANPRKGVSHTLADLQGELCDVIAAAMVALRDTTPDPAAVLTAHLAAWRPRQPGEPPVG